MELNGYSHLLFLCTDLSEKGMANQDVSCFIDFYHDLNLMSMS